MTNNSSATGGMGMRQTASPDSEVIKSDIVAAVAKTPLAIKFQIRHEANDDYPEEVLDEWEQSNIVKKSRYIREIPTSGSTRRHMEPLYLAVGRFGTNAGFDDLNALTMTFRFRRVRPRGNEGV
jgi:hypothetical protein